eukprot:SAG31_NODE_8578_length_1427_cov_1.479669_2_plen_145_part_00
MLETMRKLVDEWDPADELVGFNTRAKEQEQAQGSSDYFLQSADAVHYFAEVDAIDESTGQLLPGIQKQRAVNKVGHGLHRLQGSVFETYSQNHKLGALLRELGWQDPVRDVLHMPMHCRGRDSVVFVPSGAAAVHVHFQATANR